MRGVVVYDDGNHDSLVMMVIIANHKVKRILVDNDNVVEVSHWGSTNGIREITIEERRSGDRGKGDSGEGKTFTGGGGN
ncbi:hypothetical protein J1N35_038844 [Gossypium stocksii]|uniref:Uncharacterized protein n=1 Tax=Gossypium stocksii TaxID=47602 RepID=A0A9D3UN82_9ROSI|nr:hypothetical protein J1N35_038844 [Gossypium stocksii]